MVLATRTTQEISLMKDTIEHPALRNPVDVEVILDRIEDCRDSCLDFVRQAQRAVEIFSYDLDAVLYDQQPFLAAIKNLCLRSQFSQVRILLQNNAKVQKQGHRLVELVRRLPSSMEIRRPHPDYINHQENFLLADQKAYIRWSLSRRYRGYATPGNRLKAQQLSELFNEIWQCSQPDCELRRLNL